MLTGDKVETAVNIGYATALLRPEMEPLIRIVRAPPPRTKVDTPRPSPRTNRTSLVPPSVLIRIVRAPPPLFPY